MSNNNGSQMPEGLTISYSTFQMAWEVIEKRDVYEVSFRWFFSKKKAKAFCAKNLMDAQQAHEA